MTQPTPPDPTTGRTARFLEPVFKVASRYQLFTLAASIIVLAAILGTVALLQLRAQALAEGERLTASYAHIIEEQTTRTLQAVDMRMSMAIEEYRRLVRSDQLNATTGHDLMVEYGKGLPFVRSLWILDAQGRIVHDSDTGNIGLNLSDRDYFKIFLTQPGTTLHIGTPVRSRTNGKWLIAISRALRNERGEFTGVLVAALETAHFNNLWRDVDLGNGGAIGLFQRDGVLMMRNPTDDTAMGRRFPELPLFAGLAKSPNGNFYNTSPFDGGRRMHSYRTLTAFPGLVVTVGQSVDRVLATWWRFTLLAVTLWVLGSIAIILLCLFLGRTLAQKERARAAGESVSKRLALATDAAGIAVWDWDLATDAWTITPTYFTMLGRDPVQGMVQPISWLDGVHPDDRARVAKKSDALRSGTATDHEYEARWQHVDGSYRWIRVIAREFSYSADGKPNRLLGVVMDVTALRQAQEERSQIVDRITDAFVALDKTGRYTFANAQVGRMFSIDHRQMIGKHVLEVFPKTSGIRFDPAYRRAMESQLPGYVEEYFEPTQRWLGSHIYPSPDGMTIYSQDITSRKAAEAAVNESEERYRLLVEMSPYAIAVHQDERMVFANQAALRMFGAKTEEDLIGHTISSRLDPEQLEGVRNRLQRMLQGEPGVYPEEARYKRMDGSDIDVEVSAAPCVFDGQPAIQVVTLDITDRKRNQAALQASLHEKEFLLREVHHRVKNNLQVITSLLRLEGGRSLHPDSKTVLTDMQNRIRTMALLHESLYRAGTFADVALDLYLKELTSQVFRATAPAGRDIRLKLDLASVRVGMDQAAPCGLLVNELISNSLKHGFPAPLTGEVRVELSLSGDPAKLRLRVSDTGVGMPPDFESRRKHSLGLQLVSDLATQLGGALEMTPGAMGVGAVFIVTFVLPDQPG